MTIGQLARDNAPLRYDAKVAQEAEAEAAKFFAANLRK
jgi:hypothetical protein